MGSQILRCRGSGDLEKRSIVRTRNFVFVPLASTGDLDYPLLQHRGGSFSGVVFSLN